MIRKAKFGDIPALTELFLEMYDRSKFKGLDEPNIKAVKSIMMQSIQRHGNARAGGTCVFVIDREGALKGFIVGALEPVYHVGYKLQATDIFYYASKGAGRDAIRLFDAFIEWGESVSDLLHFQNGATDAVGDYSRVAALYERRGFRQSGVIYERSQQ